MKARYVVILCVVCLVAGAVLRDVIGRIWFPCEIEGTVEIAATGETETGTKPDAPAAYSGDSISIKAVMSQGRFFTVRAENRYTWAARTFEMAATCPVTYRPYSIQAQLHALAGVNGNTREFNALVGGTLSWLWNFSRGSVGIGGTYLHGLIIPEYYVGASVTGKLDFGKINKGG